MMKLTLLESATVGTVVHRTRTFASPVLGGLTIQVKGTNKKAGLSWLLLLLGN